ncbi:MAG: hypothetical protein CSA54_02785 [Gammaproteobacteria bacterium]|nr:MAG: hypothetical protein CSA54_02785 [Gammaproteobacteria bacterium]
MQIGCKGKALMVTEWPPECSPKGFVQRPVAQVLADLQWLIRSPVLIAAEGWLDDAFCARSWQRCAGSISALRDSSLQTLCGYAGFTPRSQRLGEYFEWLVCLWLFVDPEYSLLHRGLVLRGDDGGTLGELDFIVRDLRRDKTIHLEVAVKFYLRVPEALAEPTRWHWRWFGPQPQDRLDLKYSQMQWQQIPLDAPRQQCLQDSGVAVDAHCGLLKGRVFLPIDERREARELVRASLLSAQADIGRWMSTAAYRRWPDNSAQTAWRQAKYNWLRPRAGTAPLQAQDLAAAPLQIVRGDQPLMLVPEDWLAQVRQLATQDWQALQAVYSAAVYEVAYRGQWHQLRVGEDTALPDGYVITACNPGLLRPSEAQNAARNRQLKAHLQQCGYAVEAALGRSADGRHREPSLVVWGMPWDVLAPIAQYYAQRAVLALQQGRCRLRWV